MQKQILDDSEETQSKRPLCFPGNFKHHFRFLKKPFFKNSLKFAITIFFFWLVNRSLNQSDLRLILARIDFLPIFAALFFCVAGFYILILRWQFILKSQDLPSGIKVAAKTMFIGFFLAFLTPGRVGELFRGVGISGGRKTVSVLAVATERYFAVFLTIIFGGLSVIAQFIFYKVSISLFFMVSLILSFILFCYAGKILKLLSIKFQKFSFLRSILNSLQEFLSGLDSLPLMPIVACSTIAHLCLIFQTAILLDMFGSAEFLKNCIIAGEVYAFMLFLPFFVANIGLREFSFSIFLGKLETITEIKPEVGAVAFGVSTLILFMNIILPAILGFFLMFIERREQRKYVKDEL